MIHLIPRGATKAIKYLPWTDLDDFDKFFETVIKEPNSLTVPIPENTEYVRASSPLFRYNFYDKNMRLIHYPVEKIGSFNPFIFGSSIFIVQVPEFIRKIDFETRIDMLKEKWKIYPISKNIRLYSYNFITYKYY